MGLADGDLFVSGSILSYQQANRIYQNFRGATVPSALQAGALWSDSDDDKIYHRGASAVEEILQLIRSADVSPQFATLRLMDTGADHYLDLKCNENLSAHRLLNVVLGNTARTLTFSGSPTLGNWFDQAVKIASKPTFAGATFSKTVNWKKGADKASASTLDISALDGNYFDVTGTTDITAISTSGQAGTIIKLHFDGILTIVHDGDDIVLPDGKDIYTIAGTELEFIEYVSGKWRCTTYLKAQPVLTNLLSNSEAKVWSHSLLAQKTTGAQSDYEIGSAIYNETGEVADDSGNWAKTDCTLALTNDAGNGAGSSDNYYTITETGATQRISQALSGLTVGKVYKLSVFIENGTGTWASAVLQIMNNALNTTIESTDLATEAAWDDYSVIFVATETNNQMVLDLALGGGETAKVDNIRVIEVGPGCFASDDKALDTWTKTSTLDLLRIQADMTHCKGLYGIEVTKGAAGAEYLNAFGRVYNKETHYMERRGRTFTLGCWVFSVSAADNVKLQINDSDGTTESSFVAADTLTWVEVTRTCGATITSFTPRILFDGDSADVAYVSQPMLVFGSSIGEGNYRPRQQEVIWLEVSIISNTLNALLSQSDFGWTTLILESDSNAMFSKGCKATEMRSEIKDSGSAITDCYLQIRANMIYQYINSPWGLTNDKKSKVKDWQSLTMDGNYEYQVQASGANTFDLLIFQYTAVQVN